MRYASQNPDDFEGNALTASGYRVERAQADTMRRLGQEWQARAFAYYDIVPEIKYGANFYAGPMSLLRLYVAERDADGKKEPSDDPVANEELARLQDPGGGGRRNLLARYGQLMFLNGENYLVCSREEEEDREGWEILSTREFRPEGTGYVRYRAPSVAPESFRLPDDDSWEPVDPGIVIPYRLWKPHPMFSELADSSMQGVLDVCEELVLLTQAVRARAKSRLAGSGILLVNGKYIPLPPEPKPGEDPAVDPFMRDLNKAMTSPITNEGSASAIVPHVIRIDVADDQLDNVMKHIQIIDPMQTYPETGLRYELIKRLAIGLDMPPEVLLGLQDSNHWNAWQVDEQTWKYHLQPVAEQMVADFTTAWFQPTLRDLGVANWENLVIDYDASLVINHPDRGKDAKELFDRGELSGPSLREATGFSEDDAPSEDERNRFVGIKIRDGSLAIFGIPSLRTGGIEPEAGVVENASGTDSSAAVPGDSSTSTEKTAPAPPDEIQASLMRESLIARILGAADVALFRARELAGARLRNYARRDKEAAKLIDGVPSYKVAAILGPDRAKALDAPHERQLVQGASEILAETLAQWQVPEGAAGSLGDRLEQYAAQTLYDDRPGSLPPAFANYVLGIVGGIGDGK